MMRDLGGVFKALLLSRKFWLAVIGLVLVLVAFVQGAVDADTLVTAIIALMGILIAAIAGEDMAAKRNSATLTVLKPDSVEWEDVSGDEDKNG